LEVGKFKTLSFDYKDKDSKLVRFDVEAYYHSEADELFIKSLSITGDFFAYPPDIIFEFERYFSDKKVSCSSLDKISSDLSKLVNEKKALLVGIRVDIIIKALAYFCEKFKKKG